MRAIPPRFVLLELLGEGAFGAVHRAEDRERGLTVALKVVGPEGEERLAREASALSRIDHPGVVELIASGPGWLAMELIDGEDFVAAVRRDLPPLPSPAVRRNLPEAFGYTMQEEGVSAYRRCSDAALGRLGAQLGSLSEGLDAIHSAGFLHLDVTPDNVFVTEVGRVVVLDLGLVAPHREGRAVDVLEGYVGSPAFMAPENGEHAPTMASDWYSVGVLAFEALTGALPFDGNGQEIVMRKRSISAPAPSELVDGVPAELEALVLGLLAQIPRERLNGTALRAVVAAG